MASPLLPLRWGDLEIRLRDAEPGVNLCFSLDFPLPRTGTSLGGWEPWAVGQLVTPSTENGRGPDP